MHWCIYNYHHHVTNVHTNREWSKYTFCNMQSNEWDASSFFFLFGKRGELLFDRSTYVYKKEELIPSFFLFVVITFIFRLFNAFCKTIAQKKKPKEKYIKTIYKNLLTWNVSRFKSFLRATSQRNVFSIDIVEKNIFSVVYVRINVLSDKKIITKRKRRNKKNVRSWSWITSELPSVIKCLYQHSTWHHI